MSTLSSSSLNKKILVSMLSSLWGVRKEGEEEKKIEFNMSLKTKVVFTPYLLSPNRR